MSTGSRGSTGRVAGRTTAHGKATHYQILGVAPTADPGLIRSRYRQLSKSHHPDAGGDRDKFEALAFAYSVLNDPASRAQYDESLRAPLVQAPVEEYEVTNDHVFFDDERDEMPIKGQIARLAIYVLALVGLVALLITVGTSGIDKLVDRVRDSGVDEAPAAQPSDLGEQGDAVTATVPGGRVGHNGLGSSDSAKRWLAAFQALSGLNPQVNQADAEAIYATDEPDSAAGALCDTYGSFAFWLSLGSMEAEMEVVERELNHHLSRSVAECTNFDEIVPALSVALGQPTAIYADRLRRVESLADEAVATVSGP